MTWRLRLQESLGRDLLIAAGWSLGTLLLAYIGARELGTAGLLVPFGLALLIILMRRPLAMVTLTVVVVIVCEGPTFGLLGFTSHLYAKVYRELTPVDFLVTLTVISVGLEVIRTRQLARLPRSMAFAWSILALGMIAGAVTGNAAGLGVRSVLLGEDVLAYLLLLPLAVGNLDIGPERIRLLLGGAVGLAAIKAVLGLIEIAGHKGAPIEGASTLTYYEPTANWLIMIVLLGITAALAARMRPPLWMLLCSPLLFASLLLSYRRSFWIAAVLGLVLVVTLSLSPVGRRMLVPVSLSLVIAIWLLGSVNLQNSQAPIVRRVASLNPSKLEQSVEDRYRLDERANVLAAIRAHPVSGLGMLVPWAASSQPLSVEHPEAREYVHFAFLWFWLRLGILGAFAYLSVLAASALLAWRVWRLRTEPLFKAFGLASLCGFAGLVTIESTATFTGIDPRFNVVLGVQIGLLALLARTA
jgi:O-Antigen ligase